MLLERRPRPGFAPWRYERNLNLRVTAEYLERCAETLGLEGFTCSHETVRLICLPFGDPRRRFPAADLLAAIGELTNGEITPRHFHEPQQAAA